jgi:putative ABC transport system substrate-binding protein
MSTRRSLLLAAPMLGVLVGPVSAQTGKVWTIGILASGSPALSGHLYQAFVQGLQERGYVDGRNIVIVWRYANGDFSRLKSLASELVQANVDVIFAPNSIAVQNAKQVAGSIPIVFCTVDDPVGSGFVESLARPGRNITGFATVQNEISAKRLQILKEAFPNTLRIAVFVSSSEPISNSQLVEVRRGAKLLGMEVFPIELQDHKGFDAVLAQLKRTRAQAIFTLATSLGFTNRDMLIELAAKTKLPAMYPTTEYLAGGLMTYGTKLVGEALFKKASLYVEKILKGAKPGELPVEQPTEFSLVINMKTAKALNIKIADSVLQRADRLFE